MNMIYIKNILDGLAVAACIGDYADIAIRVGMVYKQIK